MRAEEARGDRHVVDADAAGVAEFEGAGGLDSDSGFGRGQEDGASDVASFHAALEGGGGDVRVLGVGVLPDSLPCSIGRIVRSIAARPDRGRAGFLDGGTGSYHEASPARPRFSCNHGRPGA